MPTQKILIIVLLAAVALAVGIAVLQKRARPQQPMTQSIKIGAILPRSGDFAQFGEAIHQGALLAIAENKEWGVNVIYISEDDQSKATGSTNAANKLIHIDKVDGVLTATLQEVKPIAPMFNDSSIPLLATWDSNNFIKTAGKNIFTIGFSTEDAGEKMATFAFEKLGIRKVAVIPQLDEWSELIGGAFENKFKSLGGVVALSEKAQPTQKDYRTLIAKIKNAGVDGVYFPFLPGTIAPFLTQAKQLNVKAVFMTGDSFSQDEVVQASDAAENVYFTNLYADNTQSLMEKYKATYGSEPGDPIFVSFGYDGVNTLITAARLAKERGLPVKEALKLVDIQGTNHHIRFDGGQFSEKYERLYKVVNGKFEEVR